MTFYPLSKSIGVASYVRVTSLRVSNDCDVDHTPSYKLVLTFSALYNTLKTNMAKSQHLPSLIIFMSEQLKSKIILSTKIQYRQRFCSHQNLDPSNVHMTYRAQHLAIGTHTWFVPEPLSISSFSVSSISLSLSHFILSLFLSLLSLSLWA